MQSRGSLSSCWHQIGSANQERGDANGQRHAIFDALCRNDRSCPSHIDAGLVTTAAGNFPANSNAVLDHFTLVLVNQANRGPASGVSRPALALTALFGGSTLNVHRHGGFSVRMPAAVPVALSQRSDVAWVRTDSSSGIRQRWYCRPPRSSAATNRSCHSVTTTLTAFHRQPRPAILEV